MAIVHIAHGVHKPRKVNKKKKAAKKNFVPYHVPEDKESRWDRLQDIRWNSRMPGSVYQ